MHCQGKGESFKNNHGSHSDFVEQNHTSVTKSVLGFFWYYLWSTLKPLPIEMKTDISISPCRKKHHSELFLPLVDSTVLTGPTLHTTKVPTIDTLTRNVCGPTKLLEKQLETKEALKRKEKTIH